MRRDTDDEYTDEVRDGEVVRVPMVIMDAHPTGRAAAARAAAKAARLTWVRSLSDAWRSPQRDANPPGEFTCPSCKGTGKDVDGDSPDGRCDECEGTGYIRGPNNLSSALREDPGKYPDTDLKVDRKSIADARKQATASWHAMCARLRDAWRTPSRDAGEPDASERLLRRHLGGGDDPDNDDNNGNNGQARRDAAWNSYKDQLSRAWEQGRTDPSAATAIERQGEAWRHGK
jgi:hypothetical protein